MIVAIHQPEHFPYLGFFQKMKEADLFIILDDVKYVKNSWHNRNRFLNHNNKEEWFTVPVEKNSTTKMIKDVKTATDTGWRKKLIRKLYFNFKCDFSQLYADDSLCAINMKSIEFCRKCLNINVPMVYSSTLGVDGSKSERLTNICKEVGANIYLSGPGGKNYLDKETFDKQNIKIRFFQPEISNNYSTLYNITR